MGITYVLPNKNLLVTSSKTGSVFATSPKGEILRAPILDSLKTMRDGIMDYELLKMLSQKHPDKAKEICSQIVYSFDRYNTDIKVFREKRKMILKLLSK